MSNEIWLTIEEVSELTQEVKETVRRKCKRGEYVSKHKIEGKRKLYFVQLNSLPKVAQENYFNKLNPDFNDVAVTENNAELYAKASITARKQADKYLELINLTKYMKHSAIIEFLQDWNEKYPDKKSSYASLHRAKTKYKKFGIGALLSKKGIKQTKPIDAKYFKYYKSLYLKEGAPSAFFCWQVTLGYAKKHEDFDVSNFPSYKTFARHLKKEIPKQAIYLARYGQAVWNKKYATYIPRDYLKIKAGSCWVSDHAQIDVEIVKNLIKSLDEKEFNSKVKVSKIANTSMDKIVQNERKNDYMSKLEENNIKPIFKTESEKRRREEEQARQTKLVKNA